MGQIVQKLILMMEPEPGVSYDIDISPDAWCLDADGNVPFANFEEYPELRIFRTEGSVRTEVTDLLADSTLTCVMLGDGESLIWAKIGGNGSPWRLRVAKNGIGYKTFRVILYADGVELAAKNCSISQAGAQGDVGPGTPPPMLWTDYITGFRFTDGTDGTLRYVVIHGFAANGRAMCYVCKKTHYKIPTYEPGTEAGDEYWEAAQGGPFTLLSTEVLLAVNAFINFLSGNAIKLYDRANALKGEFLGGGNIIDGNNLMGWLGGSQAAPNWAVSDLGKMFVGGISGQRIELDPQNKSMFVYDSSGNLVATHSGRIISLSDAVPPASDGLTAEVQLSSKSYSLTPSGSEAYQHQKTETLFTLTTPSGTNGGLQIELPAMQIGGYVSGATTGKVTARLVLECMKGSTVSRTVPLASAVFNGSSTTNSQSVAARTVTLTLDTTSVRLVLIAYANATGGIGTVSFSSTGKMTSKFVAKWYRCEYGANGWVISYDSENYEYCLLIANKLRRKIVCNGKTILTSD